MAAGVSFRSFSDVGWAGQTLRCPSDSVATLTREWPKLAEATGLADSKAGKMSIRSVLMSQSQFFSNVSSGERLTDTWSWIPRHQRRWLRWSRGSRLRRCRHLCHPDMFSRCNHPCRSTRICQRGPRTCLRADMDLQHNPDNRRNNGRSIKEQPSRFQHPASWSQWVNLPRDLVGVLSPGSNTALSIN